MTLEQRRVLRAERDADICACYQAGQSIAACGKRHGLGRQRVQQILKRAGAWQPHAKSGRTKFLGVSVGEQTKEALKQRANQEGVSVSRLASDALDALVKPE